MIGAMEQAILDRLTQATFGYTLRTVESYTGALTPEGIAQAAVQFPAVITAYLGEDAAEQDDEDTWNRTIYFSVIVAAKSGRGDRTARFGVTGEPGAYQMLDDISALLSGFAPHVDATPLQPGRVAPLRQDAGVAIYEREFSCQAPLTAASSSPADLTDFLNLHIGYDIPPATASGDLPATAAEGADAEDLVELQP